MQLFLLLFIIISSEQEPFLFLFKTSKGHKTCYSLDLEQHFYISMNIKPI